MTVMDTGTDTIICGIEDNVAYVVLNRPEARNAMSREMMDNMGDVFTSLELNREVRCVVLTGAGKGFCAGGDVKAMASTGETTVGGGFTVDQAIHQQRTPRTTWMIRLSTLSRVSTTALTPQHRTHLTSLVLHVLIPRVDLGKRT